MGLAYKLFSFFCCAFTVAHRTLWGGPRGVPPAGGLWYLPVEHTLRVRMGHCVLKRGLERVFMLPFFDYTTPKRNTPGFDNPRSVSACVPEAFALSTSL